MKRIRRVVPPSFLAVSLFFSLFGFGQSPQPRLKGAITETSRATLAGSRSPRALRAQDMGAVPPAMTIPGMTLVFKRSAVQENALQELLAAQQNPASPLYHQWLTPDTFAARFGIADEDIAAAETWLQSRGFHIESNALGRDRIYTFIAPATAGSHLVTVRYPGDAMHSPSASTSSILVGNVIASGGFSPSAGNLTVANGGSGSTQVTVTPTGSYSGRVAWSLAFSGSSGNLTACYAINSPAVSGTSTTKLTIGIAAACNTSSPAERGNLRPLATSAAMNDKNTTPWHSAPTATAFASLLVWSSLRGLRRKMGRPQLLVVTLLTAAGLALTGCGGAKSSDGSSTSPPPPVSANYTVTLTGTDSVNPLVHASTSFTLTVN